MRTSARILASGLLLAAMPFGSALAQDKQGAVSYALPQTTISLEVEAVKESFFAGPYAKFAKKYLGVQAREEDQVSCRLSAVKMTPRIEADQDHRYYVNLSKETNLLSLTAQGLVAVSDGGFGDDSRWRFTSQAGSDFSGKGLSSNLTSQAAVLYRGVKEDASYNRIAVQQDMVVQKSAEQRAKEAAQMIFDLREKRVQIVTGDTDATYSGEAMGAALAEIAALEEEYLSLFIGYSEVQTQVFKCDVVPSREQKTQTYVAFRISDTDGVVSPENVSGKPYLLELVPQKISPAEGKPAVPKGDVVIYRVPAVCAVKLSDGVSPILQDRVAVYQLGSESYYPL